MRELRRIRPVLRKEWRALLRDRFFVRMATLLPVLSLIILGYGINYDVRDVPIGVVDADRTAESRQLVDAFLASDAFRLALETTEASELEEALRAGRIRVALEIPSGFARTLNRGRVSPVQVLVDGSFSVRAEIARAYAAAVVASVNRARAADAGRIGALAPRMQAPLVVEHRVWFNPSLESKRFVVAGLIPIVLLLWPPLVSTLTVARERETGALLNVQAAAIPARHYVLAKLVPYATLSFLSYGLLLAASAALFRVPLSGSAAVLTLGAAFYVLATTGLGILVSILVRTQVAAIMVTAIGVLVVGVEYSGFSEPIASLDAAGRLMSHVLPTADFMTLARGVYLKQFQFTDAWALLARLALHAATIIGLCMLAFPTRRR